MQQFNNANNITISDLIIGNAYTSNQINEAFGCSTQGGMNRSHTTNTLVLFVKHNKSLYDDQWEHTEKKWVNISDLCNIDFAEADKPFIGFITLELSNNT